ncbi:hypothetical protein [Paenibacillus monticola]|uniref:DUF2564 family protein n=1 Tax=Paenibacillus monticola TaxID=2666075 RepID=A0A7X2H5X1_9BACL|nr:hypothetical protein [Paenibacillus monticola]MRN54035.1 hypothetical protein [Paenibacillus monticola]
MKRYDTTLQDSSTAAQTKNSVNKLHDSVSQALSHPNEQTISQAENSLEHAEEAVRVAGRSLNDQGVEFAEQILDDEKTRLAALDKPDSPLNR